VSKHVSSPFPARARESGGPGQLTLRSEFATLDSRFRGNERSVWSSVREATA